MKQDVKGKSTSQKMKYAFQPGRWYFIAVTMEYHFLGRDELKLYVDGDKASFQMSYPKITDVRFFISFNVCSH